MPGHEVDGFDFFAVYDTAREAIERARNGGGPSLIHARLYRYYGHFEGDAMTYRLPEEGLKVREEKDALKTFRNRVVSAGLLEGKDLDTVDTEVAKLIDDAVGAAEASAQPTEADLTTDVYVNY
jgi:pyruvate dehydrogenase E1 component alpha subunit